MINKTVLTGITTTGIPHLGNYAGAIRPAIRMSEEYETSYFFLADLHGIIKTQNPERIFDSRLAIASTWLALGLDTDKAIFYRQSDIPEIPQITWMLTCITAKGLMNRAHAYKALVDDNVASGQDPDRGITMGLFSYPILMTADIITFNAHYVPVGRDQIQHLEMARDIAQRFNHMVGKDYFVLPEVKIEENTAILPGLDGRKMSKSYDNTIPLFEPEKKLRKSIMRIVTNSQEPGEPKDPDTSHLFDIYKAFASEEETTNIRQAYADGIAWGEMKQILFEKINSELAEPRERYQEFMASPKKVEEILQQGAERAREQSRKVLKDMQAMLGLKTFV